MTPMPATDTPLLRVTGLACGHGERTVVRDVSFVLDDGEFLCLLGPNGVGKTTLFKTLLGLLPSRGGRVLLRGEDISNWSRKRFATQVGYVPQAHTPPFAFRLVDVVAMGRTAHLGPLSSPSRHDMRMAGEALEALSIGHLAERPCTEVSGGERQLALIARALVQKPALLMLDEPTANLDFGNQVRVLGHIARLVRDEGMTAIMTTHDPNHALRHASRAAVIGRDGAFRVGAPAEIVTEEFLRVTYGVRGHIVETILDGGDPLRICLPVAEALS